MLEAIASQSAEHLTPGRPRRGAGPVFGVDGGGLDGQRGEVVEELLKACDDSAELHGLDVVIVARAASDYSALQSLRRSAPARGLVAPLEGDARRLGDLARRGQLALFMGAGTGVAAGLPLWDGLLTRLAEGVRMPGGAEALARMNPLDAAEVLRRAFSKSGDKARTLGERVADVIGTPARFALSHALLAALNVGNAITTNFDDLYERAVETATGARPQVLLPKGEQAEGGSGRWLLKLHGDASEPDTVVLDRRSFVRYDAEQRPLAAVLQATLLTRHLFVVGASMNDDNVIRLVHEVAVLKEKRGGKAELGTVVTLQDDPLSAELWAPELRYLSVGGAAPSEETVDKRSARMVSAARELDVFLDRVAQHAARGTATLMDPRYSALIRDDDERRTAQKLAQLRSWVEKWATSGQHAEDWRDVLDALDSAGGSSADS
ncbi:SIR2 family protein [Klenkia terrae]|uniref:SIR2 family protein n=1 Tax=Klenkia terrae TaxID=1052259 RepID=UPI001CD88FE7|nr:SIR2 family protein [Klenkia terrae]